jgi:hypothetical protein
MFSGSINFSPKIIVFPGITGVESQFFSNIIDVRACKKIG